MSTKSTLILRPGITNPGLWYPERPAKTDWDRVRKTVLERDSFTCACCGHRALKYMNIHHLEESGDNTAENLVALCVACHAILHIGHNLSLQVVEIWEAKLSQVEIVRQTRELVKVGMTLDQIKKKFQLKRGPYAPDSTQYANDLVARIGSSPRAYLEEPLCAVFVNLKRWQIE